ncbi:MULTISPECIES: DUF4424 family protein [unclassified Bradyrhizobium]|uniref:DUF4424 family protein n=1 Tax=unclassified Bradyrhizobium TaxID=2631580 RepID=UPI0039647872
MNQADAYYYRPFNIPFRQDANFIGFQVWIDGREIKPDEEVRAFAEGGEITGELRRLGIDLIAPVYSNSDRRVVDALRRLNAISDANDDEAVAPRRRDSPSGLV